MKRLPQIIISCAAIAAVLAASFLFWSNQAKAAPVTRCGWTVVPSASSTEAQLTASVAISPDDVWAVGYSGGQGFSQVYVEHWNGQSWSIFSAPNPAPDSALSGITAVSDHNIWAVGFTQSETLIEHWNGNEWEIVPSPNTGTIDSLTAVTSVSGKDIWAVGGFYNNNTQVSGTLVEHWNGTNWTIVPSPSIGTYTSTLNAITAISSNNVWAIGYYENFQAPAQGLIEHWNGSQWQIVSSPGSTNYYYLIGVTAVSAKDIWAVGQLVVPSTKEQTLIEHWNGTQWSVVSSPSNSNTDSLNAVAAVSASDIWAVGYTSDPYPNNNNAQTLVEHWTGKQWKIVTSPNPSMTSGLFGVTAVPGAKQVWAVGTYYNNSGQWSLTEFHC